jgi:CBS domain-containing protein
MRTRVAALPAGLTLADLPRWLHGDPVGREERLYPVVDGEGRLSGLATRSDLLHLADRPHTPEHPARLTDVIRPAP